MTKNILNRIGRSCLKLAERIDDSPKQHAYLRWVADHGDRTHRLNYLLNANSLVFDVGGYEGQWTSDIYSMYGCLIHVFEPVEDFADQIVSRFKLNPRISIHQFGLSDKSEIVQMGVNSDKSSIYRATDWITQVELRSASEFIGHRNIELIDLIKINIEGGEYDLLEHLILTGHVTRLKNIQVQFHEIGTNYMERMRSIEERLRLTHEPTYRYPFIWENWRLKEVNGNHSVKGIN